jgi:hypothetical protein
LRKTSLLLETDPTVSGQAPPTWVCTQSSSFLDDGVRIDLLFTMSDNTTPSGHEDRWSRKTFNSGRAAKIPAGGARRDRTDDLLLAKQALSQLSYGPSGGQKTDDRGQKRSVVRRLMSVV